MKEYKSQIRDCKIGKNVTIVHPVNLYECEIGDNTFIGPFCEIQTGARIGKNCRISSHSFVCEGVLIKDDCFIGHGVMFINDKKPKANNKDWILSITTVFENSAIGSNATILPVSIGPNAMIGAGAVVTKNVLPDATAVGNPAKTLRRKR